MSSTPSPVAIADAATLAAAFVEVAEQSFFAFAEPCGPDALQERLPADGAWLHSAVAFQSPKRSGHVDISLPYALASDLAAAFAGCDPESLTPGMIADVAGELCNMVCGLWLTRMCPHERFALMPPEVRETESIDTEHGGFILINDVPVGFSSSAAEAA